MTTATDPRTARAAEVLATKRIIADPMTHTWLVEGSKPNTYYTVGYSITGSFCCSCEDRRYHRPSGGCKHMRSVAALIDPTATKAA